LSTVREAIQKTAPSSGDQAVILLAEYHESNVPVVRDYLQAYGYRIIVAQNGVDALEKAEEAFPSLILMDIQMPEMDGLEAIRLLRANPRFAYTPIIALTALAMPGDREHSLAAGANEYMSKPVSLNILVQTIRHFLGQFNE
jgi:CheY-like chemotaxis protein